MNSLFILRSRSKIYTIVKHYPTYCLCVFALKLSDYVSYGVINWILMALCERVFFIRIVLTLGNHTRNLSLLSKLCLPSHFLHGFYKVA